MCTGPDCAEMTNEYDGYCMCWCEGCINTGDNPLDTFCLCPGCDCNSEGE